MSEIVAQEIGLAAQLKNGAKVLGTLSREPGHTCFTLTAPDGREVRFALSDEALSTMMAMRVRLHTDSAGVGTGGEAQPKGGA